MFGILQLVSTYYHEYDNIGHRQCALFSVDLIGGLNMSMVALSLCEECIHEPVCQFKDHYLQQARELKQYPYESYVQATVNCQHWGSRKVFTAKEINSQR